MKVYTETVGLFAENTFFVVDSASGEALAIDPGDEADRLLAVIQEGEWTLRYILNTHAHLDHVGAVAELRRVTKAKFHISEADRFLLEALPAQAAYFGVPQPPVPEVDGWLAEGQTFHLGDSSVEIRVIETPGHSPGGVTFQIGESLFAGDVLFQGSIGRTDLPGGDMATLLRSIHKKLLTFPDHTVVHPGHGPITTIGEERANNPFLSEPEAT
jgi:glyoxylase-like metal-dependent hydrolase (beta-lactamase superfamily II)